MIARVLAAVLAALAVILLAWTLWRHRSAPEAPVPTPVPSATALPSATPKAQVTPGAGYRLAGTAAGLRGRYAVFEDPGGATEMYKVGDEVPGVGTLLRVGETDATLSTPDGEVQFRVRPAPTKPAETTSTAKRVRKPSPTPGRSEDESSPSDEPAPPAS